LGRWGLFERCSRLGEAGNLRTTNKARSHTHTQAQATQPLHGGPPTPIPTAFQHFLRQKKKHVPGYEWQTPTWRSRRQAGLTTEANIVMETTWIPTIQHVHVTGDRVIHANVSWTDLTTAAAINYLIPVACHKSTLPSMTRNFVYDPQLALRHFPRLNRASGPYTCVWPKSAQATRTGSDSPVPVLPTGFSYPRYSTWTQSFDAW